MRARPYIIAAVDPGKKGSACKLEIIPSTQNIYSWLRLLSVISFAHCKNWEQSLFELLTRGLAPDVVALENVHSKSRQGVKSVFSFGAGKGGCIAAIKIAGFKIHYVEQTVWPRQVGLVGSEDTKKRKAEQNAKALELFPELADVKGDIFASTLIGVATALDMCPDFKEAYMAKYAPKVVPLTPEQTAYQLRLMQMLRPMTKEQEREYRGIMLDPWTDLL